MATLDARWKIPKTRAFTILPRTTFLEPANLPSFPALDVLAHHAVEARLAAPEASVFDVAAWRLAAGGTAQEAVRSVHQLWAAGAARTIADRLLCAHILQVAHDPEQTSPTAGEILAELVDDAADGHPLRFTIVVSHLVEQLNRSRADGAAAVARLRPSMRAASAVERASFDLIAASVALYENRAASEAACHRAYDLFKTAKDTFGLAQCALAAYQLEDKGQARADRLRACAEHAVYRYEQANRWASASRVVQLAIVAMLADARAATAAELDLELARAAELAERARSFAALDLALRLAHRLRRPVRLVDGAWTFGPRGRAQTG
jgi:hypothetical protein